MMYNNRSNTYREVDAQTSSPTKLVVMLYEGAIRFLRESAAAMDARDLDRKRQSIDRAVAIVQHLQTTLDMERGQEVAADLSRLYSYITSRILEGSAKLETAPLEEAIKLLDVLLASWKELAKKEQPETPEALVAQQAASGGFELHA
jgi:flagellar secretion chaperone FliS